MIWIRSNKKISYQQKLLELNLKTHNIYFLNTTNRKLITDYLKTFTRYDPLFDKLFEEKKIKPLKSRNILIVGVNKNAIKKMFNTNTEVYYLGDKVWLRNVNIKDTPITYKRKI